MRLREGKKREPLLGYAEDACHILERELKKHTQVVLLSDGENIHPFFWKELAAYFVEKKPGDMVFLLQGSSADAEWGGRGLGFPYILISEKERDGILALYHTYEFSDRFMVLPDDRHVGSIMHYVGGGLLSWEEAFDALFSDKARCFENG